MTAGGEDRTGTADLVQARAQSNDGRKEGAGALAPQGRNANGQLLLEHEKAQTGAEEAPQCARQPEQGRWGPNRH